MEATIPTTEVRTMSVSLTPPATKKPAEVGDAPLEALAVALGQAYPGGPLTVPHRCHPQPRPYFAYPALGACYVVRPGVLVRCTRCDAEFTVWRLRRIVLDDARLTRRLARALEEGAAP